MALTVIPSHVTTRAALSKELNQFLRSHFASIHHVSSVFILKTVYEDGDIKAVTGYMQGPARLFPDILRVKRFHAEGFLSQAEALAVYDWVSDAFRVYAAQAGAQVYAMSEIAEQGGL